MKYTPKQLLLARKAKSAEELRSIARENGIEMMDAEARQHFDNLHKFNAISDEELSNVSGGWLTDGCETTGLNQTCKHERVNVNGTTCPDCGGKLVMTVQQKYDEEVDYYSLYICWDCKKYFRYYYELGYWTRDN